VKKRTAIKPTKEDRFRLTRLYEEIVSRLQESSLIVSRTLSKKDVHFGSATVNFLSAKAKSSNRKKILAAKAPEHIPGIGTFYFDDAGNVIGIDDEVNGVCRPV
jgi:hypothetical protein